jgi:hypothetical protein
MNGPIPILSEMVLCSCTAFISQATKITFLPLSMCCLTKYYKKCYM